MPGQGQLRATLGGVAVVCCVHDREKRQVRTEAQIAELGKLVGREYDPVQHNLFVCACCDNLFVSQDDEPKFCHSCNQPLVHPLGGPLPEPTGVIV
jgi:hypothetical protein